MLVDYIISILPPSFIRDPWFLATLLLHRIRTMFYSLSGTRAVKWDRCRSVGYYFWGDFLKFRMEPFLDLLNPGVWGNSWYFNSHRGLWVDSEDETQRREGRTKWQKQLEAPMIVWSWGTCLACLTLNLIFVKEQANFCWNFYFLGHCSMQWDEMIQVEWQMRLRPYP